jgi:hypothetical protein
VEISRKLECLLVKEYQQGWQGGNTKEVRLLIGGKNTNKGCEKTAMRIKITHINVTI